MSSHTPRRPLPFVLSSHTRSEARTLQGEKTYRRGYYKAQIFVGRQRPD